MDSIIRNREGEEMISTRQERALSFLYESVTGRVCLKVVNRRSAAKLVGKYMNSRLSRGLIDRFIEKNGIDMSVYEDRDYKCYNQFFTRKLKPECKSVCMESDALVAPCDSKLRVYPINDKSIFFIKDSPYTVKELVKNEKLAKEFRGGLCLVYRLSVDDYHRYIYFDDGAKGANTYIPGVLHTVNPISLDKYNYYKQNCREYTVMDTEHFGRAVQIEVGAMLIGKIKNAHGACKYRRGEEKGMFEFGGSTVVVLLKKNAAVIDGDIMANSGEGIETIVHIGERIGTAGRVRNVKYIKTQTA